MTRRLLGPGCSEWVLAATEARGLAARRRRLVGSARGRVLEIGAGTGRNLRWYRPDQVSSVVALEADETRGQWLARRAQTLALPFEWQPVAVEDAVLPPEGFDTVVATLALCRVAEPAVVAAAIGSWLVPGGRLLFLEHVASLGVRGRLQCLVTPAWARVSGGCHLDRDTLATVRAAGLSVSDCTRFVMPAVGPLRALLGSCVEAVAWRPPIGEPDAAMSVLADRLGDGRGARP
ncbi:MAG TPA: methyltransferase domain-containing protein [Acidimicrobiales bacterium]|jgi:SAM-dependent methyltransferase|nr:methyltransferase domain-containing protein [Acidimicrobiales bacterium]